MMWLWSAVAWAADGWWVGEWGMDPSRSDDGVKAVQDAFVAPTVATTPAGSPSSLSPDQGSTDDPDEQRQKALRDALGLLGKSGRCVFSAAGDASLEADWGDGVVTVPFGNKWTKVTTPQGDRYRVRAWSTPEMLVVERRFKTNELTESWVPPSDADTRDRVVVVRIVGPSLPEGVEFRRVYRRLDP